MQYMKGIRSLRRTGSHASSSTTLGSSRNGAEDDASRGATGSSQSPQDRKGASAGAFLEAADKGADPRKSETPWFDNSGQMDRLIQQWKDLLVFEKGGNVPPDANARLASPSLSNVPGKQQNLANGVLSPADCPESVSRTSSSKRQMKADREQLPRNEFRTPSGSSSIRSSPTRNKGFASQNLEIDFISPADSLKSVSSSLSKRQMKVDGDQLPKRNPQAPSDSPIKRGTPAKSRCLAPQMIPNPKKPRSPDKVKILDTNAVVSAIMDRSLAKEMNADVLKQGEPDRSLTSQTPEPGRRAHEVLPSREQTSPLPWRGPTGRGSAQRQKPKQARSTMAVTPSPPQKPPPRKFKTPEARLVGMSADLVNNLPNVVAAPASTPRDGSDTKHQFLRSVASGEDPILESPLICDVSPSRETDFASGLRTLAKYSDNEVAVLGYQVQTLSHNLKTTQAKHSRHLKQLHKELNHELKKRDIKLKDALSTLEQSSQVLQSAVTLIETDGRLASSFSNLEASVKELQAKVKSIEENFDSVSLPSSFSGRMGIPDEDALSIGSLPSPSFGKQRKRSPRKVCPKPPPPRPKPPRPKAQSSAPEMHHFYKSPLDETASSISPEKTDSRDTNGCNNVTPPKSNFQNSLETNLQNANERPGVVQLPEVDGLIQFFSSQMVEVCLDQSQPSPSDMSVPQRRRVSASFSRIRPQDSKQPPQDIQQNSVPSMNGVVQLPETDGVINFYSSQMAEVCLDQGPPSPTAVDSSQRRRVSGPVSRIKTQNTSDSKFHEGNLNESLKTHSSDHLVQLPEKDGVINFYSSQMMGVCLSQNAPSPSDIEPSQRKQISLRPSYSNEKVKTWPPHCPPPLKSVVSRTDSENEEFTGIGEAR